ncbi:MAG: hypothetical protein VB933_08225 [Pseudomonadales bacterium]
MDLKTRYKIAKDDPTSWNRSFAGPHGMHGYVRTTGSDARFLLETQAPRAFQAQADIIGGRGRLPNADVDLAWSDAAIGNLGTTTGWHRPNPQQQDWHKDGWHFRHFLNSPEQGLLIWPVYSNILPESGGTFIATDSIGPVARLLAEHPEGLHPDGVQGSGYVIPNLIEQCAHFEELTGEAGDMVLVHPYILHRVSENPSDRPRFIANSALELNDPMRFNRPVGEPHSLVELAVLRALQTNRLEFNTTRPMQAVVPGPFRSEDERSRQNRLLNQEMRAMAATGLITSTWGEPLGYASNRR